MREFVLSILLLFFILSKSNAQLNIGGKPVTLEQNLEYSHVEVKIMPSFDSQRMLEEDRDAKYFKTQAFRFAKSFNVDYSLNNSGTWEELADGSKIWRLGIYSPGAYSLNVIFKEFYIPEGAKLYIFNTERSHYIGGYNYLNNNVNEVMATEPVAGDYIIIEYFVSSGNISNAKLTIGKISHDYRGIFSKLESKDDSFESSGSCNVDINCAEGNDWQQVKHSVTRIIIDGSKLCSGALINNTRNDATPYYLTANHCINTLQEASVSVFYFNYESPFCKGIDGYISQTISGAGLVATAPDYSLDFTLLKLNDNVPPGFKPYYAGWNRDATSALHTTCIHHPQGDVKKISIDENAPVTGDYGSTYDENSHWLIEDWELGTTEGGSSGAPLFDQNKRIIGDLTGGEANCQNSVNDYYAKFSMSWADYGGNDEQLKHWLDPDNTDVLFLDGFDPNANGIISDCGTTTNFSGTLTLYPSNAGLYLSGNNEYGDLAKAEYFELPEEQNVITGGNFYFGVADGENSDLTFIVWDDNNGEPGIQLASVTKSINEIELDVAAYQITNIKFLNPVRVSGPFYIGVFLPNLDDDVAALYTNATQEVSQNTGWEMLSNGNWFPYTDTTESWGISLNHAIYPTLCTFTDIKEIKMDEISMNVYPNPFDDQITIDINKQSHVNSISVFNYLGRKIYNVNVAQVVINKHIFNLKHLAPGIYFIKVETNKSQSVRKIIKVN